MCSGGNTHFLGWLTRSTGNYRDRDNGGSGGSVKGYVYSYRRENIEAVMAVFDDVAAVYSGELHYSASRCSFERDIVVGISMIRYGGPNGVSLRYSLMR
jgi:hypothetical protein